MVRVTREAMLMGQAHLASMRSTCSRLAVGVILARDGRILSSGYNGAPAGMPHCDHSCDCEGKVELDQGVKVGDIYHRNNCALFRPCIEAVHAEANAIAYAAKHGQRTESADLFTTHSPCTACAMLIINAGIEMVWYGQPFRDVSGLELLRKAEIGVDCLAVEVDIRYPQ